MIETVYNVYIQWRSARSVAENQRSRRHTVIIDGLTITVIGMAIVFGFLVILVMTMIFLNFVLRKFFPKSLEAKSEGKKAADAASSGTKKDDLADTVCQIEALFSYFEWPLTQKVVKLNLSGNNIPINNSNSSNNSGAVKLNIIKSRGNEFQQSSNNGMIKLQIV